MKRLWIWATTALAAGRTRFRSDLIYEYTENIDCSTAKSRVNATIQDDAACAHKCSASEYCAKTGFDVGSWRKCLIDLGPTCQITPDVFFGSPIAGKGTYYETNESTVLFKGLSATMPSSTTTKVMYRWAIPESLAEECAMPRWIIKSSTLSTDLLPSQIVRDWQNRPYIVVVANYADIKTSSQNLVDTLNDGTAKSRCLYDESGHFYGVGAHSFMITGRVVAGARASKTFHVPLNVRDEWYIGNVPNFFYDT